MNVEHLLNNYGQGKTLVLGRQPVRRHFALHISQMNCPGSEASHSGWQTGDWVDMSPPESFIWGKTGVTLNASRMFHVIHDSALFKPSHGIYILRNISLCSVHPSIEGPQTHLQAFSSRLSEVYSLQWMERVLYTYSHWYVSPSAIVWCMKCTHTHTHTQRSR